MAEVILPGTYITVRDEGLISAGAVASSYIGIVGTAEKGPINEVQIIGSFTEAQEIFGKADLWLGGSKVKLTLVRALELIYNNGGQTVYAVRTDTKPADAATYQLLNEVDSTPLINLEAKTKGAIGNEITISVIEKSANIKQIILNYGTESETFTGANATETVNAINKNSNLVFATVAEAADSTAVIKNIASPDTFTNGRDAQKATLDHYKEALAQLENEIVNIVLLAGQDIDNAGMATTLQAHLNKTAEMKRERIGLIGSNGSNDVSKIADHTLNSDRMVLVAPGVQVTVTNPTTRSTTQVTLPGGYLAAAVAGRIASLPVQASPTNKAIAIDGLSTKFNASQLEKLVQSRVLAIEKRQGYRITKGITTATNSAWHQITTRRIVDYAIYGVRSACNPYIGKLNNERVRGAMRATLDAFLTRMVTNEALVGYQLDVSATRAQEIAGETMVTMTLKPTFSIDFIKVTMYLG